MTRILVPLDNSELSESALPIARLLAAGTGAQVHLVAVSGGDQPGHTRDWYAYLEQIAAAERESGMLVRTSVRSGDPAHAIVVLAREIGADMVVMATHGRTGLGRTVQGSVADRVLRASTLPVVLLRAGAHEVSQLRTLLVPIDGTADGAVALSAAAPLARACNAHLLVVHAVEALTNGASYPEAIAARLRGLGLDAEGRVVNGRPADVVASVADEAGADLIVMSTHARSGPIRTLLGSVADEVVRRSQRPVLLVRRAPPVTGSPEKELTTADRSSR